MNKTDFTSYISDKHTITKAEAAKMIDMFTSSIIDALGEAEQPSALS